MFFESGAVLLSEAFASTVTHEDTQLIGLSISQLDHVATHLAHLFEADVDDVTTSSGKARCQLGSLSLVLDCRHAAYDVLVKHGKHHVCMVNWYTIFVGGIEGVKSVRRLGGALVKCLNERMKSSQTGAL